MHSHLVWLVGSFCVLLSKSYFRVTWLMSHVKQLLTRLKCRNYFSQNGLSDAELGKLNPPTHVQIVVIFCHVESFAKHLSLGKKSASRLLAQS